MSAYTDTKIIIKRIHPSACLFSQRLVAYMAWQFIETESILNRDVIALNE